MSTNPAWRQYQEDVASFFRVLGFDAQTDVKLAGVRTEHAVDVVVRSTRAGFPLFWLIECKDWQSAVPKAHVLLLRQIVADVGADRGILMSESGFQSGALEATHHSNVQLCSLEHLRLITADELAAQRITKLFARAGVAKEMFWDISKEARLAYLMKSDAFPPGDYPAIVIFQFTDEVLAKAHRSAYPIQAHLFNHRVLLSNPEEVVNKLEEVLGSLEGRLAWCMREQPNWPRDEDAAYEHALQALKAMVNKKQ